MCSASLEHPNTVGAKYKKVVLMIAISVSLELGKKCCLYVNMTEIMFERWGN